LRQRPIVVQQPEEMELTRRQIVLVVRSAKPPHRVLADECEQQALARGALLKKPPGDSAPPLRLWRGHFADTVSSRIVD
jgi:hypothetical protein